jgi:hypothetical protein
MLRAAVVRDGFYRTGKEKSLTIVKKGTEKREG